MLRRKNYKFTSLLLVLVFLLVLSLGFFLERGGVRYSNAISSYYLEDSKVKTTKEAQKDVAVTNLVIYDSREKASTSSLDNFRQIFMDMRVGSDYMDIATTPLPSLQSYETVVVLTPKLSSWESEARALLDWVQNGGNAMFGLTLKDSALPEDMAKSLGIEKTSKKFATISKLSPDGTYLLGGGETFDVSEKSKSAWKVSLVKEASVLMTGDSEKIPLVWTYDLGQGRLAMNNFGFYGKAYRGFYAASFSLLGEASAYPVINGSAFTLDDFPSPVPSGDVTYIKRDYQMNIADFYSNVWWPDMMKFADTYGLKYTGAVTENFENDTSGNIVMQTDQSRYSYFGKTLLKIGGEIGYMGYNHQPLVPSTTDLGSHYGYNTWSSSKAMKASLDELMRFTNVVFPRTQISVYVAPSNILSPKGRKVIAKNFPEIKAISGSYFAGDFADAQEFQVAKDGLVDIPSITSGIKVDDQMKLRMLSELNMHYVSNHSVEPDDALDVNRGAKEGWNKLFNGLSDQYNWLYTTAPSIRNFTESQLAGAVQRYAQVTVTKEVTKDKITFNLGNFTDEAYLMVRINNGHLGHVTGGTYEKLADGLYLLHAKSAKVELSRT